MVASIVHRVTGVGLSFAGLGILTWWLLALSNGTDSYASFEAVVNWTAFHVPWALLVLIAISWSLFQHLLTGIRHLVMDSGAGFEIGVNKTFAALTIVGSVLLTALTWFYILGVRK